MANEYKPGETVVIDDISFIADAKGQLHRTNKNSKRPKADWEDVKHINVPYSNGKYEIAEIHDKNNDVTLFVCRQWILDDNGKSAIRNKQDIPIPKKTISLGMDANVATQIAKAITKLVS